MEIWPPHILPARSKRTGEVEEMRKHIKTWFAFDGEYCNDRNRDCDNFVWGCCGYFEEPHTDLEFDEDKNKYKRCDECFELEEVME